MVPLLLILAPTLSDAAGLWRAADGPATSEVPRIAFTDEAGRPQTTPLVAANGAYPGMPPEVTVVTLSNDGTVPVTYDFSVAVTSTGRGASLADVLQVTLRRATDDAVTYEGSLAELSVSGDAPLQGGESAAYVMTTSWPDGGTSDNAYQGSSLAFDIEARAHQVG